ncbi:MAG: ParA family protein [bacterium]|nr:ParA family protein [bacterium]
MQRPQPPSAMRRVMQVLPFVNQKGGCGKTTTAVNLAGALAARGERVLLVDLDPQAHATLGLGCAIEDEPTAAELLLGEVTLDDTVVQGPGGIDLVPSERRLAEFEEASERLLEPERRLQLGLENAERTYDWVLVDCPPRADGVLCANALYACTTAMLIVETGAFALQGALQAQRVLAEVAENQGREFGVRVVGTMFDRRTKFARELLVALHARFGDDMLDTVIRTSVRLREAPALGLPVHVLDPSCRAATDFSALAEELILSLTPRDELTPAAPAKQTKARGTVKSVGQGTARPKTV